MASEREPGFYWVRTKSGRKDEVNDWTVGELNDTFEDWCIVGCDLTFDEIELAEIGPRCYPPPEQAKRSAEQFVAELKRITRDAK